MQLSKPVLVMPSICVPIAQGYIVVSMANITCRTREERLPTGFLLQATHCYTYDKQSRTQLEAHKYNYAVVQRLWVAKARQVSGR